MLFDLGRAGGFRCGENGDYDACQRLAGRNRLVVLDAIENGLEEKRAAADAGLDVLREGELAGRVGLDAAEVLRALVGGLVEGDCRASLGLAGGAIGHDAIDAGIERSQQK